MAATDSDDRLASAHTLILQRIDEHLAVVRALRECCGVIVQMSGLITARLKGGGKVLAFGNGGSAADAQHFVAELVGRYYLEREAIPAVALTTNTSNLTAIANDEEFDRVFARQLEALGRPGDVAVGLSTSGSSRNVVAALRKAREMQLSTIGMTGENGGAVAIHSDICLAVPSSDTPRVQEAHITVIHAICELVEKEIAGL